MRQKDDLISRQALCEYALNQKDKSITPNDIMRFPSAQPEHTNSCYTNSWCIDCKEYDTEKKCCPRFNRVIKQTLDEIYAHAETEAEARYHAQQKWIPCSERLPENKSYVLTTIYIPGRQPHARSGWFEDGLFMNDNGDTWKSTDREVCAWMPLPEPYAERRTDG